MHLSTKHCQMKSQSEVSLCQPQEDLWESNFSMFSGIWKFLGEYYITLHDDAYPFIDTLYKGPLVMWPHIKEELNRLDKLSIITSVTEPMDWNSSLTYLSKASSKLQICLNPKDFNLVICHDHHNALMVEEITYNFVHWWYWWKVTVHPVTIVSSFLTKFNSPFHIYYFQHLPFGHMWLQDIFQCKTNQILECYQGAFVSQITSAFHAEMKPTCVASWLSPNSMVSSSTLRSVCWSNCPSSSLAASTMLLGVTWI